MTFIVPKMLIKVKTLDLFYSSKTTMISRVVLVVAACCLSSAAATEKLRRFPDTFLFGASSSAYQVEGGWNEDGKGLSTWDEFVHSDPNNITDRSNGDIAVDSYHQYKRDVQMLKELGVQTYRFSISWTRILPNGRPDHINPQGIAYYNSLIDELLTNGIQPVCTIYHWDLPQTLMEQGGLLSEEFPQWLADYSRILFKNFGDRVKTWITINEPYVHCYFGYGVGMHAPGIISPGEGFYQCGRNILLANAEVYHIYDEEFRSSQGGQIGIVINMEWGMPSRADSKDDQEATEAYLAFVLGQYMDPIFSVEGNYPQLMIDRVAAASAEQGYNTSRLPTFTSKEIDHIKGSADFLGLNHYSTFIVYRNASVSGLNPVPSASDDAYYAVYNVSSWTTNGYAPGFYKLLLYIKDTYNNPNVYITENGLATDIGLNDEVRVGYINNYLSAVLDAMSEGANVKGYSIWSLMDSFEWYFGYTLKYGLYEIDLNDPLRTRVPRKSALVYKQIVSTRTIDHDYNPDPSAAAELGFSVV